MSEHVLRGLGVLTTFKGLTASERFVWSALKNGALKFDFDGHRMGNGRTSPYFFDIGIDSTGDFTRSLTDGYIQTMTDYLPGYEETGPPIPEVIFGPTWKILPAVMSVRQKFIVKVGYACNIIDDEEGKTGDRLIGASMRGKKVLLISDTITTGVSSERAVETVRRHGGVPVGYVVALDRQEYRRRKGVSAVHEFEGRQGIPVHSVAQTADLISVLKKVIAESGDANADVRKMLDGVLAYQERYGVS